MADHTQVDVEWAARYERATAAARSYAKSEGLHCTGDLIRLAQSADQRTESTAKDRANPDWTGFFARPDDDRGAQEWDEADEKRRRWNQMHRDVVAKNAKAEADRVAAREAEDQAKRDKELADLTDQLRRRYLTLPGGTEEAFQKALPELLENHRRRFLTEQGTADDIALAAHRAAFKI